MDEGGLIALWLGVLKKVGIMKFGLGKDGTPFCD